MDVIVKRSCNASDKLQFIGQLGSLALAGANDNDANTVERGSTKACGRASGGVGDKSCPLLGTRLGADMIRE